MYHASAASTTHSVNCELQWPRLEKSLPNWDTMGDDARDKYVQQLMGMTLQACSHGSLSTSFCSGHLALGIVCISMGMGLNDATIHSAVLDLDISSVTFW